MYSRTRLLRMFVHNECNERSRPNCQLVQTRGEFRIEIQGQSDPTILFLNPIRIRIRKILLNPIRSESEPSPIRSESESESEVSQSESEKHCSPPQIENVNGFYVLRST